MSHCTNARPLIRFGLPAVALLVMSSHAPAQSDAPVRALPLPSVPHAPSLPGARAVAGSEYDLSSHAEHWPKDPTLGGVLGGVMGCASGALLGRILSSAEQRTRNTWAGCLWLGAVGVGTGSGWRVPGKDYFRPR